MIKRYNFIFSILLIISSLRVLGQEVQTDTLEKMYGKVLCDTLPELADSVFSALKTKKFERLAYYAPTTELIKAEMDTQDVEFLQRMSTIKYQYIHKRLRKDFIIFGKEAKYYKCNLRNMTLLTWKLVEDEKDGHAFGTATLYVRDGKDEYYITFAAIELQNRWFVTDHLRIVPAKPNTELEEKVKRWKISR